LLIFAIFSYQFHYKAKFSGAFFLGGRGDTEGLKDRPEEVKETLLLPRKCLFASERHLLPSGNAN
jgi:hypothetical protein